MIHTSAKDSWPIPLKLVSEKAHRREDSGTASAFRERSCGGSPDSCRCQTGESRQAPIPAHHRSVKPRRERGVHRGFQAGESLHTRKHQQDAALFARKEPVDFLKGTGCREGGRGVPGARHHFQACAQEHDAGESMMICVPAQGFVFAIVFFLYSVIEKLCAYAQEIVACGAVTTSCGPSKNGIEKPKIAIAIDEGKGGDRQKVLSRMRGLKSASPLIPSSWQNGKSSHPKQEGKKQVRSSRKEGASRCEKLVLSPRKCKSSHPEKPGEFGKVWTTEWTTKTTRSYKSFVLYCLVRMRGLEPPLSCPN